MSLSSPKVIGLLAFGTQNTIAAFQKMTKKVLEELSKYAMAHKNEMMIYQHIHLKELEDVKAVFRMFLCLSMIVNIGKGSDKYGRGDLL